MHRLPFWATLYCRVQNFKLLCVYMSICRRPWLVLDCGAAIRRPWVDVACRSRKPDVQWVPFFPPVSNTKYKAIRLRHVPKEASSTHVIYLLQKSNKQNFNSYNFTICIIREAVAPKMCFWPHLPSNFLSLPLPENFVAENVPQRGFVWMPFKSYCKDLVQSTVSNVTRRQSTI